MQVTLKDNKTNKLTNIQVEIKFESCGICIYVKSHEPAENQPIAVFEVYDGDLQLLAFTDSDVGEPANTIVFETSIIQKAKEAYAFVSEKHSPCPEKEEDISKDAKYAYYYALYVLKGPFLLGEKAISENAFYSSLYATQVLKGRFELGEKAISQDIYYSFEYARDAIKGRFELGEKAIFKDADFAEKYQNLIGRNHD